MPQTKPSAPKRRKAEPRRLSVGLPADVARNAERYAATTGSSMSKAVATLVRLGLESQQYRKREFIRKLKQNLANEDPRQQDEMIDEFTALILGR